MRAAHKRKPKLGDLYQVIEKTAEAGRELQKVRELHETADQNVEGNMPMPAPKLRSTEAR